MCGVREFVNKEKHLIPIGADISPTVLLEYYISA